MKMMILSKKNEYSIEKPGSKRLICSLPGCFYDVF